MTDCGIYFNKYTKGKEWKTAGDDVQYCIEKEGDNTLLVHYQCSTSKRDWINNFNIIPKKIKILSGSRGYIWLHRGLWSAFVSAWCTVVQDIDKVLRDDKTIKQIRFTGHSFGGAMAFFSKLVLLRETFSKRNKDSFIRLIPIEIIIWGAPRVIFCNKYEKVHILFNVVYENYNDLVPYMPPFYKPYKKIANVMKVGLPFNLKTFLTEIEHNHTCYGEL